MEQHHSILVAALQHAKEHGYSHDVRLNEQGNLVIDGEEIPDQSILEAFPCFSCGATLYLIASNSKEEIVIQRWAM